MLPALLILSTIGPSQTAPQTAPPPSTDIFLVDLSVRGNSFALGKPLNITARDGYDNQPMFLPDGQSIFYTSIREDAQADIYRYSIESGSTTRVTETKEAEYSATVVPGGKYFSVIRVEADSTQRLWKFPINGGTPALVLEKIKPVGYHVWLDENTLMLFILGTPNTMQLVDTRTEHAATISTDIGRSLHKRPGKHSVSFVHKVSAEEWWIKEFDVKTRNITPLARTLAGREDYAWTPDGSLLMGNDSKLYKWTPAKDREWQEVADFSQAGLKTITRIAVSPKANKLAFVAETAAKR